MKYRNIKTGVIIDVNSVIGGDWEPVNDSVEKKATETEQKEKKGKAKK